MAGSLNSASRSPTSAAFIDASGASEEGDPFNITPTGRNQSHRYSSFDSKIFSSHIHGSPSQAKRALEAHIVDTDRRMQDAAKLGTSLVEQKRQLAERLREVEQQQGKTEMGPDLRQKLIELEKEVNQTSKESARAFIPKSRKSVGDNSDNVISAGAAGEARTTPGKLQGASSRKQRNQPSSKVNDVEFATEISTSLLGQVRNLQNMLAKKEEALKNAKEENSQLQADLAGFGHRLRNLDDNEQRFKDENWNLETQVQDLTTQIKELAMREHRVTQALGAAREEKSVAEREQDDLRQAHNKLVDEHADLRRQHDLDLSGLRRDLHDGDGEREILQRKVDELTSQNQDLAKAVAYRTRRESDPGRQEALVASEPISPGRRTPEPSPPPSPTKGTPRHGALESETLRSSLTHAHRTIQNLKNNIHREKTEKVELKRMLQDARDDLEARRVDGGVAAANAGKKRTKPFADGFKKPNHPGKLGEIRSPSDEIINDPTWEDHDGSPIWRQPTKSQAFDFGSTDVSEAFATADENGSAATDNEAFETSAVSLDGDSEGNLTEREGNHMERGSASLRAAGKRSSYQSTASDDDNHDLSTPSGSLPRYKLKLGRGGFTRSSETPTRDSPASFASNRSQARSGQNLADELENMDDASVAGSTPSRATTSRHQTPDISRHDITIRTTSSPKPRMVDSGMVTDPWEPSPKSNGVSKESDHERHSPVAMDSTDLQGPQELDYSARPTLPLSMSDIHSKDTNPITVNQVPPTSHTKPTTLSGEPIPATEADEKSMPPVVQSIGRENSLAPSTQSFLRDILQTAHSRDASDGTLLPTTSGSTEERSAPRAISGDDHQSPFTISIPGRELKNKKKHGSADTTSSDILQPNKSLLSSVFEQSPPTRRDSGAQDDDSEPVLRISREDNKNGTFQEPTLQLDNPPEASPEFAQSISTAFRPTSSALARDPTAFSHGGPSVAGPGMVDEGTQTTISADQIDKLMRVQNRKSLPGAGTSGHNTASPLTPPAATGRAMSMGTGIDQNILKSIKRPSSAGGTRNRTASPPPPPLPPLPADHKEVIAAASRTSSILSGMPPPPAAASGTKSKGAQDRPRPRTPSGTFGTPTPRNRTSSVAARSDISRRSSVSSFASELDERFNIAAPNGGNPAAAVPPSNRNTMNMEAFDQPGTDPRMILAITQTMIGEFLWKYTRKAGRENHSEKRHKRFFWIHPYTRTLYWSNQDPSAAGRVELKAKSVSIEAVRVISDDNPIPPGLHPKSIVVVTPGRSIKFTAPTTQRHETWFNALTYLLLRSTPEQQAALESEGQNYTNTHTLANSHERSNTLSSITSDEISEFNPSTVQQPYSRTTSRLSRASIGSSMASNRTSGMGAAAFSTPTANRTASPQGRPSVPSLAVRQSQAAQKRVGGTVPAASSSPLSNSSPVPMPRLSEAGRSHKPSRAHLRDSAISAGLTGEEPLKVTKIPQKGQDDGFKKPSRPFSMSARNNKDAASTATPNSGKSGGGGGGGGKLSSLTSRLRPPSFASLKSRKKGADRSAEVETANRIEAENRAEERDRRDMQGHSHGQDHGVGSGDDGALENVRACCDGRSFPVP